MYNDNCIDFGVVFANGQDDIVGVGAVLEIRYCLQDKTALIDYMYPYFASLLLTYPVSMD
jgi:hypothetical protein